MTTASAQTTGVSFRGVQALLLSNLGVPAASGTTEYAGVRILGAKALTINRPEWQRIPSTGDDVVLAQFILPPQEGASAELRTGAFDMTAESLLTGLSAKTVGEMKLLPGESDNADLPDVLLLAWREAKSIAAGDEDRPHYEFALIPSCKAVPRGGPFEERNAENRSFNVMFNVVGKWPWGEALSQSSDGCATMQLAEGASEYIPRLSAFLGDGATGSFTFGKAAQSTAKVKVYKYTTAGVFTDITAESYLTVATSGLTFSSGNEPAASDYIIVLMEVSA